MKTLLLMRHAKSSWADSELSDHDRPLNDRGRRDAPKMGRYLAEQRLIPDFIFSSTAKRARKTAQKVAAGCGYTGPISHHDEFYAATSIDDILQFLRCIGDDFNTVLMVGHNPTWEIVLEVLSGNSRVMPTAAVACVRFTATSWSDCGPQAGLLEQLWLPRELS